ncbi:MAG TPA: BTAD domain-containing putative transcriptional regulator [Dongiaceae bacterium]
MARPHLSLFGGFEVDGDAAGQAVLTRKARAMVAYLALQSGRSQSREKLAALLWGGNGELQARTNLRQALSVIRKAIPSSNGGRFATEGDSVVLNLDDVDFDVAQFQQLVAGSSPEQLERAVALYRGDLLDGFSLGEEPFEDWLRVERERLRAIAIAALEKLVLHYLAVDDFARCTQAATRLLALEPLREDIHRALMQAYAAQDRINHALKQYELCRDALQRELGLPPEPETDALYKELRARRMKSGKTGRQAHDRASLELSRLLATQAAVRRQLESNPPVVGDPPLPTKPSVAILPFGGEDDQAYFANGIAEDITTGLSKFHELFVIDIKSSLAAHKLTTDVREIGRQLGVAHIVVGSVRKAGSRVRVTAQLVEAATAQQVWAERYDGSLDDVFAVQDEITDRIVKSLAGRIEQASRRRAAEMPTKDMAAYDHLLQAREHSRHRTREGEIAARLHLDRALALDPNFAGAYATYAVTYIHDYDGAWCKDRRAALDEAYRLARKAVALDPSDARTHYALAWAALYRDEFDLAKDVSDRAMSLNPHDLLTLCVRSWIVMFAGRPEEALSTLHEELLRCPIVAESVLIKLGMVELMAALYREAAETFARMSSWDALRLPCLAACHAQLGDHEKARGYAAKVFELAAREFADAGHDPLERWSEYVQGIFRFQRPDDRARFVDGLRKAGLPFDIWPQDSSRLNGMQAAVRRQLELVPAFAGDLPLPAKPSVAILPFDALGGEIDQAYFANGIAENIITGLTRFHDLFVIGHKSSLAMHQTSADVRKIGRRLGVAHVVEGSVRKTGDRVRVTAQLVEAATGRGLWAEQYDRCSDDLFAVQDEIADLIVTTLAGRIEQASRQRAAEKPVKDMLAYDHLLRAREHTRHRTQEGELAARIHLDRALELDAELASAYACYAVSYIHEYEAAWCADRHGAAVRAFQLGRKAVALDETDAYTHHALAYAAHYAGHGGLARKEIDRAILLNPHDYHNLCVRAWITMFAGRPAEALSDLNEALRLNPFASENCLITIGIAEFMAALYQESCVTFAQMSSWDPLRFACEAACHAQLGQSAQARASADQVRRVAAAEFGGDAASSLERWRAYAESIFRFGNSADLARFADGLHRAGLPFQAQP